MCTVCLLCVYCVCTACVLRVYCVCTACVQCVYCVQTVEEFGVEGEPGFYKLMHVNLDPRLVGLLREIHYLSEEPFNVTLSPAARTLVRTTNAHDLRVMATRLETIVNKYNDVVRSITEYELPLFEKTVTAISEVHTYG